MTNKLILVTGASGFIATHCIVELLNHGYKIKGTIRDLDRAVRIRTILEQHTKHIENLEFVQAELTEPQDWEKAMHGCGGVLHIASPVPIIQPKNADELIKPAREGTLNVLKAAKNLRERV